MPAAEHSRSSRGGRQESPKSRPLLVSCLEVSGRWVGFPYETEFGFCRFEFNKVFNLPVSASRVWLKAYSRPGKWRVPVKILAVYDDLLCVDIKVGWRIEELTSRESKRLLKFKGKTIYVECEYE